jgi:hypothetical protein
MKTLSRPQMLAMLRREESLCKQRMQSSDADEASIWKYGNNTRGPVHCLGFVPRSN